MKRLVPFLILLMTQGLLPAQATRADSLFAIWSDTTNSDEVRVEAFFKRFDPLLKDESRNPEAFRWSYGIVEARTIAQKKGMAKYLGRLLVLETATYFFYTKEMDKVCQTGKEAIRKSLAVKDYNGIQSVAFLIRNCWDSDLIDFLEQTLSLDTLVAGQIPLYSVLAWKYFGTSHLPEALKLAQRLIVIAEPTRPQDLLYLSEILASAGSVHLLTGNYEEAETYLSSALEHAEKSNFPPQIGSSYIDLAELAIRKKDLNMARKHLDAAMVFMMDKEYCEPCMAKATRLKAGIKNLEGNFQEALEELLSIKAFHDNDRWSLHHNLGNFYSELSNSYLGLQQYNNAITTAQSGIEKTDGNLYSSLQSYENIYKAYDALGNEKMAFEFYQKYINARDEITRVRNGQQVTKQELAFQYEQQHLADSLRLEQQKLQQELIFQQEISRQKNNRNIFLALCLIAAILAISMYARYRFVQKTKTQLEEKNRSIEAEKKKAEASEKAKHQFLANMSHEFRTPMNAIKGMTDILLRREPQPPQISYLNAIKESSNSLLVIINDVLDMSKIEAGKIDLESIPFSLEEVIQNVCTISQLKAEEKGLLIQKNIDASNLPTVQGDPTRLHQVLLNLMGNAIKFTEKGLVTIQLKTENLDREPKMLAHFCVSDTGIGIGEDRLEKIFESFEQAYSDTTRKFGGTGLGLSISRKLVELQGGKIWAESSKGKGSQFYFTIPYQLAPEAVEGELIPSVDHHLLNRLKGVKILLVEDNNFNAIVAKEELEDAIEDAVVEVAGNGVIAIEKVTHGDFDIILMDVQMPIMNGYEATHTIRNLSNGKSKIPIIAMTANVMKEEVEYCYEAGMDDFIGKPFDTEELFQKILKLLK